MTRTHSLRLALIAAMAFGGALAHRPDAVAQVPAFNEIALYQNGVEVGRVYRTDADPARYAEHWVLSPRYAYPSARNGVVTEMRPSGRAYATDAEFFRAVPWEQGSRYVHVDCADGTTLPGR
jgi:hypothetical protein